MTRFDRRDVDPTLELWPIADWMRIRGQIRSHYDGCGKWVSAGQYMTDAPFDYVFDHQPPDAATSVAFYNRWRRTLRAALDPLPDLMS